jgi:hypothetical protein
MYHTRPEAVIIASKSTKPYIDFTIHVLLELHLLVQRSMQHALALTNQNVT